jgi:biopolymer transport protein ExbD
MALDKMRVPRKQQPLPKLQITAMMDMFTIIMIFLLVSFSSRPETLQLDKTVELPQSAAKQDYTKNIKLVLSQTSLQLQDELVASLVEGKIVGLDSNNLGKSILYQKLAKFREEADNVADKEEGKKEHILFFCDKNHSFKVINDVIKTAGMAGYPNLQFAVLEK